MPAQWTDHNTKRFLLYIIQATGVSPTSHFEAIATKMGPEFTVAALSNKFQRLKAAVDKDEGSASPATTKAAKGSGKGAKDASGNSSADEAPAGGRKRKGNGAGPKKTTKKAKQNEAGSDVEDDDILGKIKAEAEV